MGVETVYSSHEIGKTRRGRESSENPRQQKDIYI